MLILIFISLQYSDNLSAKDCPVLRKDVTVVVELKSEQQFENCFSLRDIPSNTPVRFTAWSVDSVLSKVKLFEVNADSSLSYLSEYSSDSSGALGFESNTANRDLVLNVKPISKLSTNKNLTISFMLFDGIAQIIANIDDVPDDSSSSSPPGRTGGCYYVNGTRICQDEK
jgi:hypothetical protein